MHYVNATPVLRVSDYGRAKAFYMDVLGFDTVLNEAGEDETVFGILRAGAAQIFLQAYYGADAPFEGWRGYFYVPDMDALIARLKAHDQPHKGPETTWYGMREIEVTDPDGNVLCFGQDAV